MLLDCMDDHTATRYFATCRFAHAGYHDYPVKQQMTVADFRESTQLDVYFTRMQRQLALVQLCSFGNVVVGLYFLLPDTAGLVWIVCFGTLLVLTWCRIIWLLCTRRVDCCSRGWLGTWRRRYTMPRVVKLSEPLMDARLLPYLPHLTELITCNSQATPLGKNYPLPPALRTLQLYSSPDLTLEAKTLPPKLTSLTLGAVNNKPLPKGVLPQSLTSLHTTVGFDACCPIVEGVLPSNLQRLELDEWTRPLSHIALPASLTELSIQDLSCHPLSQLPPQLEKLSIGGAFNQPLTGILPSSLRVLRLTGHFNQLTAAMFASTPQLEELYLSDHSPARMTLAGSTLPHSLQVLRLGEQYTIELVEESDVPPQLRRVIVPAGWETWRVSWLQQFGQTRHFTVEQETS